MWTTARRDGVVHALSRVCPAEWRVVIGVVWPASRPSLGLVPCAIDDLGAQRSSRSCGLRRTLLIGALILIGSVGLLESARSDEPVAPSSKEHVQMKTITGLVSGIGPGFIAVEFQRDEKTGASLEMALPVDPHTKFQSVESLKSLTLGDTVMVECQETTSKDSHGDYTRVKRAATAIALLKRAPAPEVAGSSNPEGHE